MLFGDEVINSERLTVPHYDMKNRGFMLWPLFEIAPTCISLTARAAPCWIISARKNPPAGNPLFLAFAAIVVIGCLKSLPL
jgi:7,8-dihydro-6-hydroxymethylpterin-pyrophosphokinase